MVGRGEKTELNESVFRDPAGRGKSAGIDLFALDLFTSGILERLRQHGHRLNFERLTNSSVPDPCFSSKAIFGKTFKSLPFQRG